MLLIITILSMLLVLMVFHLIVGGKEDTKSVKERMQSLRRPTRPTDIIRYESEKLDRPLKERLIMPLLESLFKWLTKVTPSNLHALALEKKTRAGGDFPWNVGVFIFFWLLSAIGFTACTVYYVLFIRTDLDAIRVVAFIAAAFLFGAYLPILLMNMVISKRQAKILRQLPEMLDLVCVSVQAGLAFDGALTKVVEQMQGPLVEECRKMLQEVKMGMTRRQALVNLAERCRIQEISLFTAAIIQSDKLGVGLAKTLVVQSENMRERRRQSVKAQALKAPVKIILPLVLFIFPTIFIIALVPAILTMMKNFIK